MESKSVTSKVSKIILILLIAIGAEITIYEYRVPISTFIGEIKDSILQPEPCSKPITYKIGTFDERFDKSREQFLSHITAAEKIWDVPMNKRLFQYSEKGELTINLIYDFRQKATTEMSKIDSTIKDYEATYNVLKIKFENLTKLYGEEKTTLETRMAALSSLKLAYEKTVENWNSQGGAPSNEFKILEQERLKINNEITSINNAQKSFNNLAGTVNSTASALNKLIKERNIDVKNYNTIGYTTGPEFNEGEYVSDSSGTRINIYQFDDNAKLTRVLAHELGHALGMDHVDDKNAIMYRLNESSNEEATMEDIVELKRVCKVK